MTLGIACVLNDFGHYVQDLRPNMLTFLPNATQLIICRVDKIIIVCFGLAEEICMNTFNAIG